MLQILLITDTYTDKVPLNIPLVLIAISCSVFIIYTALPDVIKEDLWLIFKPYPTVFHTEYNTYKIGDRVKLKCY